MARGFYVDQDECISCESCVELCPNTFQMQEGIEKAVIINLEGDSEECVQEAIDTCPSECIHWED